LLFTPKEHILDFKCISLTKFLFLFVILKAKTSLFPAARAWKHDKRQEKTKGIWPATKESPTQQNRKTDTANRFCPHALALVGTAAAFSH